MKWFKQIFCIAFSATIYGLLVSAACRIQAGEIEPRSYINTPVGVDFLLLGYVYTDGGLSTAASSPIKNAELEMDNGVVAYAHSFDVMGNSAKIDIIAPYSELSGSAMVGGENRERNVSGLNDPRFRFSMNFFGAPALTLDEFATYQQDLIIGASVQVSPPLGQYDNEKLVNLGNNRWFIKPDIGISKAWGPLALELSGGVFLFSDNNDFFGGKVLEQDPIYATQLHVTYNIMPGMWFALSGTVDQGGRTQIDGIESDDLQNNSRIGATLAIGINKNNSLKFYTSNSQHTIAGSDFELFGVVWQYRWGGGL